MEHNPVVTVFLVLGIIIGAARGASAISRRLKQPRVLGELIMGVILGPTVINLLDISIFGIHEAHIQQTIFQLAQIGVLLLMFKVGLEVHVTELRQVGFVSLLAGVIGALAPVVVTVPLVMAFHYEWQPALFAGVTLAATSVSISAQTLLELGVLRSKEGNALLASAVIDDIVALLLVSLTLAITGPETSVDAGSLLEIVARMGMFIVVAFLVSWYILPFLVELINRNPADYESFGIPAFAIMTALLFGWAAEYLGGVAAITGAFIAGVGLGQTRANLKHQIETAVDNIDYSFLVPIFFISVGLQVNLHEFTLDALPLALLLLIAAVLTKILGCGAGASLGGFDRTESLRLGACMISRGEVGLIITSLGLGSGIFTAGDPLFPSLFLVILLTTLITPPMVRWTFQLKTASEKEAEAYAETRTTHHPAN